MQKRLGRPSMQKSEGFKVIELAARTGALFEGIVKLPSIGMLSPSK